MTRLGVLLDHDDISDHDYQEADDEHDALFDRLRKAEDEILAAPISSDADVIAELRVITQGVRLGNDVVESLERLQHHIEQYSVSGKQ